LKQSTLHLEALKSEIQFNDKFRMLYGELKTDKWASEEVELKGQTKIFARGSGQQIRGLKYLKYRPDLIILDDLEDDELVQSADRRSGLQRWLHSEVYPALDVQTGRILYIGTILHYDSLLMKVLSKDMYLEWDKSLYKSMITETESLWPEHLTIKDLAQIKEDYIQSGVGHLFYAEYQNEPRDSESQFFRREDWRYYDDPELAGRMLNTFMTMDLAVSRGKQADYTVVVVVSVDSDGGQYIREIRRGKWGPKEIVDQMFLMAGKWSPSKLGVEDGIEWQTLRPYVDDETKRRGTYLPLEELKHGGRSKKESPTRIRGLDPLYKTHKMFHLRGAEETKLLEDELFTFPSGKHDDIIDALAYIQDISRLPGESSNEYEEEGFTAYSNQ
jgi:phage terminase large subunit-like protein